MLDSIHLIPNNDSKSSESQVFINSDVFQKIDPINLQQKEKNE